jgi:hypothetical protein
MARYEASVSPQSDPFAATAGSECAVHLRVAGPRQVVTPVASGVTCSCLVAVLVRNVGRRHGLLAGR